MKSIVVYPAKREFKVCEGAVLRLPYETGGTIPKLGKWILRTGGRSFSFQKVSSIYALFANQHKLKSVVEMLNLRLYNNCYVN